MGITVFTGCEEATTQNLIYETINPVKTLDPQTLSGETDLQVAHSIYRALMRFDSGGNIVPDIASDYKISNNNKTYRFNISDDAFWSSGEKVTAYDFEFAFKRAVLPETEAPFAHSLSPIVNATKIQNKKKSVDRLGVKALNSNTLEISLAYACVDFLQVLTTPITMPCNEKFFLDTKGYYGLNTKSVLTCGKYTLSTWNENYCSIKSDTNWVYFYFNDTEKYFESLKKDDVDISKMSYYLLDEAYKKEIDGNYQFISDTVNFLTVNPKSSIANQSIVNALMSVAEFIPNESMANRYGISQTNSIYPLNIIGTENISIKDNADKFRKNAEDLFLDGCEEFSDDYKIPPLTLIYIDDPVSYEAAIKIASIWQSKFGITVNIESVNNLAELYSRIEYNNFDFSIVPVTANLPSSHSYVEQFTNSKVFELFSLNTQELLSETKKLHNTTTKKQLEKISRNISNNIYIKPLYQSSQVYYINEDVTAPVNSYSKRVEFENSAK